MKTLLTIIALLWLFNIPTANAFWNNTIVSESVSIQIGEWEFESIEWDPNKQYLTGEIVEFEGKLWIKTQDGGGTVMPSTNPPGRNFWQVLED